MATMKMPTYAGGGGNIAHGEDNTTHASGTPVPIPCGFKPKYVNVSLLYSSGGNYYLMTCLYKDDNPNIMSRLMYNGTSDTKSLPNTSYTGIGEITDTGFTLIASNDIKNLWWCAIG